jgi:hypothetical protein
MKKLVISLIFFILLLTLSVNINSKPGNSALCRESETVIFSFVTKDKKSMSLCEADDVSYIIYRYGIKNKIELEFPHDKTGSWKQFKYSYYLRGGGAGNEGVDFNYLKFENNGFSYSVYEEYTAAENKKSCGIKVINEATGKEITIPGMPDTIIGTLANLRDYKNIQIED